MQSRPILEKLRFMQDRMGDMLQMSDDLAFVADSMQRMYERADEVGASTHDVVGDMADMHDTLTEIRDHVVDFDDVARPLRNYLYWDTHCVDIPVCSSMGSAFDGLGGIDELSGHMGPALQNLRRIDALIPRILTEFPPIIAVAKSMRGTLLTLHSSFSGLLPQMSRMSDTATAMGAAFDTSKADDYFYLPPEAFDNPDFQRGLKLFLSSDGHAARFIITHDADPTSPRASPP